MRQRTKKRGNYAFIDSQNLNLGTQKMGWKVNWAKFRHFLAGKYNVSNAYLFIGYLPEHESMYNQLHELGYLIVLKPTVGMFDEKKDEQKQEEQHQKEVFKTFGEQATELLTGANGPEVASEEGEVRKPAVKGNIDAELVLYAMKELNNYDKAIIVSGDGDFYCLAEYLAEKNKLLHIMTPNWQYSSLLKPYEKYIVRLDKERRQLTYYDHRKK